MRVSRIISGGQSGVDRAALDVAIELSISYGGWCPRGGWAEDLPEAPGLLDRYPKLQETETRKLAQRTEWNVRDSDATLILYAKKGLGISPGTVFTQEQAQHYCKPAIVLDIGDYASLDRACDWLGSMTATVTLNVAGPRESEAPGIYEASRYFIEDMLSTTNNMRS